jgi:two-component sensor histidine kinase
MLNLNPYLKKLNNHNPLLFNSVLWLFSFVVLIFIFSKGKTPIKIDYIYTFSFLTSIAIPVIINLYILIPYLLKKERYWLFIIAFIVNLVLFTQLNVWFFEPILNALFPDYFFISYHSNTEVITIFIIFLIATTLIKLSEDWFHFNSNENRNLKLQNEQIQLQLSSLRSQINPHFLFNSLNVIYALTIEKKEGVKDAIVQLSDILRYIIYDSNTEQVSIKDEIKLLKNYIEFQKFRVHGFNQINLNVDIENENFMLYPMLLLPLVENSFKHGVKSSNIKIQITQKGNNFSFKIENCIDTLFSEISNENSGVGLENVKKNLDIVYPNAHEFTIAHLDNKFIVILKISKS